MTLTMTTNTSQRGQVRNGVVVLDGPSILADGQTVEVIPISDESRTTPEIDRSQLLKRMKERFEEWAEEDRHLSDEDAEVLDNALKQNRGIQFRSATVS